MCMAFLNIDLNKTIRSNEKVNLFYKMNSLSKHNLTYKLTKGSN